MTLNDLLDDVEIQGRISYYYYDYEKDELFKLPLKEARNCQIKYIYPEDGAICIEVEHDKKTIKNK